MEIQVIKGDITKLKIDAIVNAANKSLLGGGGVDGAIHRAGGADILEECKQIGGCKTGEAVITTAGRLGAKKVIHTVGPIWKNGKSNEPDLLYKAYINSLKVAQENALKSIAFPNISTGVYRFPKERAADIALSAVRKFVSENNCFEKIVFCCFDDENYILYQMKLTTLNQS